MKMRQLIRGIVAVASPIPTCYFFSACFALPLVLMNEFFNYSPPDRSEWLFLPCVLASPILCCVFIALAIRQRKEPHSGLCILLSAVGLVENALLWLLLFFLGNSGM